MKNLIADLSPQKTAKIVGVALVVMFFLGIFDMIAGLSNLIAPGDGISTISTLLTLATDVVVALGLYVLLKPVNQKLALLMAVLRLVYVALALVFLFINAVSYGPLITHIFFVPSLFILGYLVFKSGFIPRSLGVLLIIASFGSLLASYGHFLLPEEMHDAILLIGFVLVIPAEISLGIWLLFKGVDVEKWEKRALESA
jgi:hypothetical protein